MKKSLGLFFFVNFLSLCLSLTACGSSTNNNNSGNTEPGTSGGGDDNQPVEVDYENLPVLNNNNIYDFSESQLASATSDAYYFKNNQSYRSLTLEYGVSVKNEYQLRVTAVISNTKYRVSNNAYELFFEDFNDDDYNCNPTKVGNYSIEVVPIFSEIESPNNPKLTVIINRAELNVTASVGDFAYGDYTSIPTITGIDQNQIASKTLSYAPVTDNVVGEYKTYKSNERDYSMNVGEYSFKADIVDIDGIEYHTEPVRFHVTKTTLTYHSYTQSVYYLFNADATKLSDYPYSGTLNVQGSYFEDYSFEWKNPNLLVDYEKLNINDGESTFETTVVFKHKNTNDLELPVTVTIGVYLGTPSIRNSSVYYNAEEQEAIIDGFSDKYMEIVESDSVIKAKNVGTYPVKIKVKDGCDLSFHDYGEDIYVKEVVLTWTIKKVNPETFYQLTDKIRDYQVEVNGHLLEMNDVSEFILPYEYCGHDGNYDIPICIYRVIDENNRMLLDFDSVRYTDYSPVRVAITDSHQMVIEATDDADYSWFNITCSFGGENSNFTDYSFKLKYPLRFFVPERMDHYHDFTMNVSNRTGSNYGRSAGVIIAQNGTEIEPQYQDSLYGYDGETLFKLWKGSEYRIMIRAQFSDIKSIRITTINNSNDYDSFTIRVSEEVSILNDRSDDFVSGQEFSDYWTNSHDVGGRGRVVKLILQKRNDITTYNDNDYRYIKSITITYRNGYSVW